MAETTLGREAIPLVAKEPESAITVIENPSLDERLGLLVSRSHDAGRFWQDFIDVLHLRVDGTKNIKEANRYAMVSIGRAAESLPGYKGWYDYAATGKEVLPAPSIRRYISCFIPRFGYERLMWLLDRKPKEALESIYQLLDRNVEDFSLAGGKLVLPMDYASLRI